MRLFDFFKQLNLGIDRDNVRDKRKAECPSCHGRLSKIPGAKTKCLNCGEFMFVRTNPKDNVRIIVTKAEADRIDEEWTIVSGTHDIFVAEKKAFETERAVLRKKFKGKEPSENDIKWGLLNKHLLEYSENNDWGLYRNTRFEMAEILRKEMKLRDALKAYLEVCYFDLNGSMNRGRMDDPEILKEFPVFDPKVAFIAPGIVNRIKIISKKLRMNPNQIKEIFISHNEKLWKNLKLPISPEKAWKDLELEIRKTSTKKNHE